MDKFMPLRKMSKKQKRFKTKPWISKGIRTSIICKNNMYDNCKKQYQDLLLKIKILFSGTTPALMRDSRHSVAVDKISGDKDSQGQDGANGDTIQSRSDKWKAKHEAMLKLAVVSPEQSPPPARPENLSSSKKS